MNPTSMTSAPATPRGGGLTPNPNTVAGLNYREQLRHQNRLRRAAPEVLAAFRAGRLSGSHVDALMKLTPEDQRQLLPIAYELTRESTRNLVSLWLAVRAPVVAQLEAMLLDLGRGIGRRYTVRGGAPGVA
jgi:hypothetical protein